LFDERDFQKRVQKIGELVRQLESIADPAAQAGAKELVQLLLDLHSAGLERMLEMIFQSGESGAQIIDDLGRDPLVGSLLILYGLHPEELQSRVERKLGQVASRLHKMGAEAKLMSVADGVIRVWLRVDRHACGSTTRTVQALLEEAIYEAAPDLKGLVFEGQEEHSATSGFIPLEKLSGSSSHSAVALAHTSTIKHEHATSDGMD
jgi:hypothetical protein